MLRCSEIERYLAWDGVGIFKGQDSDWQRSKTHLLDVPASSIRYNRLLVMPIEPRQEGSKLHPSPGLRSLIQEARRFQALVDREREKSLPELAEEVRCTASRFARVVRLNYLAPDIITSIIDGTQPGDLTRAKLVTASLPMDWALQRRLLGFPDRLQPEGGE